MRVALRDRYVEYVLFMGVAEKYPPWFEEELYDRIWTDESRYTFWMPLDQRTPDYYEKQLVEDYSVFLRKPSGEVHVTDYDTFNELFVEFTRDNFYNCGIAALEEDCIEYVECLGGAVPAGYPEWFYEFFTESINFPPGGETIFLYDTERHQLSASLGPMLQVNKKGEVSVLAHCVFLRNRFGEIRTMLYSDFIKHYDPEPLIGG